MVTANSTRTVTGRISRANDRGVLLAGEEEWRNTSSPSAVLVHMNIDKQAEQQPDELPLSLNLAAEQLGCSALTVRRMIKDGRLKATKIARPQGYTYQIAPEDIRDAQQTRAQAGGQGEALSDNQDEDLTIDHEQKNDGVASLAIVMDLLREVRQLNKELRETSNTATMFQTENQYLKDQVKLLQPPPPQRRWYYLWLKAA